MTEEDEMEQTFQMILKTKKDDPAYAELIETYEQQRAESLRLMRIDTARAYRIGKEAGVTENRILEVYEKE